MQVRVYQDDRKEFKNCPDSMTIYFPIPKRLQKREQSKGCFCAGHINSMGGFNGMYWDSVNQGMIINGNQLYLGKRIKRETLPEKVQNHINELEKIWNNAVTKDDESSWDKWNKSCGSC